MIEENKSVKETTCRFSFLFFCSSILMALYLLFLNNSGFCYHTTAPLTKILKMELINVTLEN